MRNSIALRATGVEQYFQQVNRYPLLSREDELALALRYRDNHDVNAAHTLVVSNLRFVIKIANQYKGYGLKLLDLIQEGNLGLMQAVKKFDPDRGYRLISYAVWWIRAQMQSFILRNWSLVKMASGRLRRKMFFKLRSERSQVEQNFGGTQDDAPRAVREELSKRFGVSQSDLSEMELRLASRDFSLDTTLGDDSTTTHTDILPEPGANPESIFLQRESNEVLDGIVEKTRSELNEKERYILEHRLLSEDPPTLASIGKQLGVSRERIRQLEHRTIEKLKKSAAKMAVTPALSQA